MGQEIDQRRFSEEQFQAFDENLRRETELLGRWFAEGTFADDHPVAGFELEAWLVDREYRPAPINEAYLARLGDPLVVPELARFNVELNGPPQPLHGDALSRLHQGLEATWRRCRAAAGEFDARLLMVGILPTLEDHHLTRANMSPLLRYHALDEQVLRQRQGRPLQLDIVGRERLTSRHHDVMLEAGTTSFQLHLQVPPARAVRYYNAALILSAPLVAVAANSPYLFGRDLWAETRVPLFEQAVEIGGYGGAAMGPLKRVTFGSGYALESLHECFVENRDHYPVLLPKRFDQPRERLPHLQLHNGTIWRWNRPLIGFDDAGRPHLRIEQRVVPGGPTVIDEIANAALFFGLAHELARRVVPPELGLPFSRARENFYTAARLGLDAHVSWLDGHKVTLRGLLHKELLPAARRGLEALEIDGGDIDRYLGVIEERLRRHRSGSEWQREFVARNGRDMRALVAVYAERQGQERPVAEWV